MFAEGLGFAGRVWGMKFPGLLAKSTFEYGRRTQLLISAQSETPTPTKSRVEPTP